MNKLNKVLGWFVGLVLIFSGFPSLVEVPLAGLLLVMSGLLALPPTSSYIQKAIGVKVPVAIRIIVIILLFIFAGLFLQKSTDEKESAYFEGNKEDILNSIQSDIEEEDFDSAIDDSERYLVSGDPAILELNEEAQIGKLFKQLESMPEESYADRARVYEQLLMVHPESGEFSDKFAYYRDKADQKRKEIAEAEERERELQELKDSARYSCQFHIEQRLKNPDSVEYERGLLDRIVVEEEPGIWLVQLKVNATNGFNAMVQSLYVCRLSYDNGDFQLISIREAN